MKTTTKRAIYTILSLFVILSVMILYLAWPFVAGKHVTLALRPIDPFDPLRGQYFILSYEISSIPATALNIDFSGLTCRPTWEVGYSLECERERQKILGKTVYVSLQEDEKGIWRYASASFTLPEGTFITGKVREVQNHISPPPLIESSVNVQDRNLSVNLLVEYGIEQYFIERGAMLDSLWKRNANITVDILLTSGGRAAVNGILENGEPVELKYRDTDKNDRLDGVV